MHQLVLPVVMVVAIYGTMISAVCLCFWAIERLERRRLEAKRLPRARSLKR
jgi:hypothetical protein